MRCQLPDELYEALVELAKRLGVPVSDVVRRALRELIEAENEGGE